MPNYKTKSVSKKNSKECCPIIEKSPHPDHSQLLPRLKRAHGQIAGIERMITDSRYCVDILVQLRAVMAALRSIEVNIFETHLKHCLTTAMLSKNQKEIDIKIEELTQLLSRRTSL